MTAGSTLTPETEVSEADDIRNSQKTVCCVVGGGPGGMMLALLLARQRVPVMLLEQHRDFDREFRGDTIHPSIMEILDQIGLAEPLHQLRHEKITDPLGSARKCHIQPDRSAPAENALSLYFSHPSSQVSGVSGGRGFEVPGFQTGHGRQRRTTERRKTDKCAACVISAATGCTK